MRRLYRYIIVFLVFVHAYFLVVYGISTFVTTILFYYTIYIIIAFLSNYFLNEYKRASAVLKLRHLFILLILIELLLNLYFVFNVQRGIRKFIIFSENKREKQIALIKKAGYTAVTYTHTEAYTPDSRRVKNVKDYSYVHQYNKTGFRGSFPAIKKDSNEIRIVILGDSFIEGDGTPEDSTISVLLQKKISKNGLNCTYAVMNGGISGSNPIYEIELYYRKLKEYNPDIVILSVYNNDLKDLKIMNEKHKININESILSISSVYRVLNYILFSFENFDNVYLSSRTKKNRILVMNQLKDSIAAFRKQLHANGSSLFTMYIPSSDEIKFSKKSNKLVSLINYDINFYSEFRNKKILSDFTANQFYWENDAHLTPAGYNLLAELLADKLTEQYPIIRCVKN